LKLFASLTSSRDPQVLAGQNSRAEIAAGIPIGISANHGIPIAAKALFMETLPASAHPLLSGIRNLFSKWWLRHPILLVLGVGITLLACFCAEEYWRGRHAWEQCKRELLAKGAILDCAALTPPTVPDEMNFFKAPGMTNWFSVTGQNEFMKKLSTADLAAFAKSMDSHVLAEI
jgi:hypothetical protein